VFPNKINEFAGGRAGTQGGRLYKTSPQTHVHRTAQGGQPSWQNSQFTSRYLNSISQYPRKRRVMIAMT